MLSNSNVGKEFNLNVSLQASIGWFTLKYGRVSLQIFTFHHPLSVADQARRDEIKIICRIQNLAHSDITL